MLINSKQLIQLNVTARKQTKGTKNWDKNFLKGTGRRFVPSGGRTGGETSQTVAFGVCFGEGDADGFRRAFAFGTFCSSKGRNWRRVRGFCFCGCGGAATFGGARTATVGSFAALATRTNGFGSSCWRHSRRTFCATFGGVRICTMRLVPQ